ncbi:MAG TPA: DapH/DapD/GlmU-related protein [Solirubrobacteraceae bacterium]|nr:DapH/DapD/GlmU-related protein [Solirubrobacteraceae bacterium]
MSEPFALRGDSRAPGLLVADNAQIADDVSFGAYVVVHPGTLIGAHCAIGDHVVLGKRPRLASASSSRGEVGALQLAERVTVGAGAVVFAGARIGADAIVGDQAFVRERATVGAGSLIGRGSVVDNDASLGARVRVQTGVYLTAFTVVEDDVFIGPGVVMTNDHTMSRHPRGAPLVGPTLRRACRVGGGAVLTPGVEIGEEAFVAAGAVVAHDVPSRAVVMGVPAHVVREVADEDLLEHWL